MVEARDLPQPLADTSGNGHTARDLATFEAVLRAQGAPAALAYLNAGVPHRYSAVYRFSGSVLCNVLLHDKLNKPRPHFLAAFPVERSLCRFVQRDAAFGCDNTSLDPRLEGHPWRGIVASYHSVPLLRSDGVMWGTLSHFELATPSSLSDGEFALLEGAAGLLSGVLFEG